MLGMVIAIAMAVFIVLLAERLTSKGRKERILLSFHGIQKSIRSETRKQRKKRKDSFSESTTNHSQHNDE